MAIRFTSLLKAEEKTPQIPLSNSASISANASFAGCNFTLPASHSFMPDVINYLGISERTYYRKIADGKLVPRKWEGPDFFHRSDLKKERKEGRRRGRV